jgi:hypothetical protein
MAIFGWIGKQRNGKTALATFFSFLRYNNENETILSNMESLSFPTKRLKPIHFESKEEMKKLINGLNCSILLDEAHLWVDSRNSKKNTGKTYFISQCGKILRERGDFHYTTQYPNQIDKRLRYNTDVYLHVEKKKIDGHLYFKVKVNVPKGDWAEQVGELTFDAEKIFSYNLYDKFETVEVEG